MIDPNGRQQFPQSDTKSSSPSIPSSMTLVNRVDRLRLLGNGVVCQTAAKAFATLSVRLDKHLKAE